MRRAPGHDVVAASWEVEPRAARHEAWVWQSDAGRKGHALTLHPLHPLHPLHRCRRRSGPRLHRKPEGQTASEPAYRTVTAPRQKACPPRPSRPTA